MAEIMVSPVSTLLPVGSWKPPECLIPHICLQITVICVVTVIIIFIMKNNKWGSSRCPSISTPNQRKVVVKITVPFKENKGSVVPFARLALAPDLLPVHGAGVRGSGGQGVHETPWAGWGPPSSARQLEWKRLETLEGNSAGDHP